MSDRARSSTPQGYPSPGDRSPDTGPREDTAPEAGQSGAASRLLAGADGGDLSPLRRFTPTNQHQAILGLQRAVGNDAVQRMLRGRVASGGTSATEPSPPVRTQPAVAARLPGARLQRGGGLGSGTPGPSAAAVGIAGGESATPSDQTELAPGYVKRADAGYDTPYGRVVDEAQAMAESKVINSAGIFMGAYLARYEVVKKLGLAEPELDKLSSDAGFMKQFETGNVVLRLMNAEDSAGLAKITESHYSHSGIVQVGAGGRVWVLDSYPDRGAGAAEDSTQLIRFEEFFADHHGEQIVQGLVLRIDGVTAEVKKQINDLIDRYAADKTKFDRQFKVDNGDYVLYCSELVWRILKEAGSTVLPPNEFDRTKQQVDQLIGLLQGIIAIQKLQKVDTAKSEEQLRTLQRLLGEFQGAGAKELYSPGGLERTGGLKPVAGFTREGNISGVFKLVVVSATLPDPWYDTPDPYVEYSGGGLLGGGGRTRALNDTAKPVWNEPIAETDYESLAKAKLTVKDEDTISDDTLATFQGDLRPVKPAGQTFNLDAPESTLKVRTEAKDPELQAPRD
jgi:hypothetical protein